MAKEVAGRFYSKAYILTTKDNANIGADRLSLRVVGESGEAGQMPLEQNQALDLAIALIETVQEVSQGDQGE